MRIIKRVIMAIGMKLPSKARNQVLRLVGMKIGTNTRITPGFYTDRPESVTVGSHCFINHYTHLHNGANKDTTITFGDNVFVGPDVSFVCATHQIGPEYQRAGKEVYGSIVVEDGVWIGAGSIILPGVKISRGSVIGAGAVVTRSTKPNGLYLGVPAKRVKDFDT